MPYAASARARASGFTLLEILAVVVVLGLVGGLSLGGLSRAAKGDPLDDTIRRIADQGQWLRQSAVGRGERVILAQDGWRTENDDTPRLVLPRGVQIRWQDSAGADVSELDIDRCGRSLDVWVTGSYARASGPASDQRSVTYRWLGLSGQIVASSPPAVGASTP